MSGLDEWIAQSSDGMTLLIVIFGFIGLIDKMRGGYKAVQLSTGPPVRTLRPH